VQCCAVLCSAVRAVHNTVLWLCIFLYQYYALKELLMHLGEGQDNFMHSQSHFSKMVKPYLNTGIVIAYRFDDRTEYIKDLSDLPL
jgi:ADP-glucose pyrophosphorylase